MAPMASVPIEVYPLVGMIGCALTFGTYVAQKELLTDQDLRLGSRGYDKDHWQHKLEDSQNGTAVPKERFQNVFYQHIIDTPKSS
ncbi:hypothetical protein HDU83_002155 [Entophlyctis luteolus]|nr:hypothetical protein HDU82_008029 [Entophlyctis luteolus]KAJ3347347.1 hypothetical protein HDU83_002155 [Entophlyctis luteolus]